jgi:hypothetical protein
VRTLFEDDFLESLGRKFSSRPKWVWTELAQFALLEERAAQRAWVEAMLERFDDGQQAELKRRLSLDKQFEDTLRELAVAARFAQVGYAVEYEPEIDGVTPDLVVADHDGHRVIVETWNRNRDALSKRDAALWDDLRVRINTIPRPLGLHLEHQPERDHGAPTSGVAKRIVSALRPWLVDPRTRVGSRLEAEGYAFRVIGDAEGGYAGLVPPGGGGVVDSDRVLDAVRTKVISYKALAERLHCGLVVVVSSETGSPLDRSLVESALAGKMTVTMSIGMGSIGGVSSRPVKMRETESPEMFDPALSGVAWLQPQLDAPGELFVTRVPSAAHPLRPDPRLWSND